MVFIDPRIISLASRRFPLIPKRFHKNLFPSCFFFLTHRSVSLKARFSLVQIKFLRRHGYSFYSSAHSNFKPMVKGSYHYFVFTYKALLLFAPINKTVTDSFTKHSKLFYFNKTSALQNNVFVLKIEPLPSFPFFQPFSSVQWIFIRCVLMFWQAQDWSLGEMKHVSSVFNQCCASCLD